MNSFRRDDHSRLGSRGFLPCCELEPNHQQMVSSSVPYCGANSCVSTDRLAHERGWTPKLADSDPTHENSHPDCSTDSTILNDWPSFLNVLSMLVSEPRQVHDGS